MCCIFKRRREAQRDERPAKERSSRRPRSKSLANNVFSAQKTRSPKMITRKKKLFLTSSCYCLFLRETRDTTRPGLICLSSEQIRFSLSLLEAECLLSWPLVQARRRNSDLKTGTNTGSTEGCTSPARRLRRSPSPSSTDVRFFLDTNTTLFILPNPFSRPNSLRELIRARWRLWERCAPHQRYVPRVRCVHAVFAVVARELPSPGRQWREAGGGEGPACRFR